MTQPQQVVVVGPRLGDDTVTLKVVTTFWSGWTDVRITRGIERMPGDFTITLTELYPDNADRLNIQPGDECEVWIGTTTKPTNRVLTGYVDRHSPGISAGMHSVTISGRGKCQDLVDCSAEWPGQQIIASSVLEVAQKLAAPFGITAKGTPGPAVGQGGSIIPVLNMMIGETPWEIIEKICRVAALLPYELADGSLRIVEDPGAHAGPVVGLGFKQGVNVQSAHATFSADQRFKRYRAFFFSWDPLKGARIEEEPIATEVDESVKRYRPKDIVAEMTHGLGEDVAKRRTKWEMTRRFGRSRVVQLTTDSWRGSTGELHAPGTIVRIDLPALKLDAVEWMVSEVTFRKSEGGGTQCDITAMPKEAFSVQPVLPLPGLPWELAKLGQRPVKP